MEADKGCYLCFHQLSRLSTLCRRICRISRKRSLGQFISMQLNTSNAKSNAYGHNDERQMCTLCLFNAMRYPYTARVVLESIAKRSREEASVLCKALGTLRTNFMKLIRNCRTAATSLCHTDCNKVRIR